jgi:hypothetical protein
MAAAAIVAILGLRGGVQQDFGSEAKEPAQESAAVDNP